MKKGYCKAGHMKLVNELDVRYQHQHQIGLQKQEVGLGLRFIYILAMGAPGHLHSHMAV